MLKFKLPTYKFFRNIHVTKELLNSVVGYPIRYFNGTKIGIITGYDIQKQKYVLIGEFGVDHVDNDELKSFFIKKDKLYEKFLKSKKKYHE